MMPGEVHDHSRSIAVIGMACRFPGADSVDRFWRNLAGGVESIRRFSAEELTAAGVDRALLRDPAYVMASPVLDGIDQFDAELFACSPREAALLDPQQRLFLECCWEALEDSGYPPDRCPGSVGVVAGAGSLVGSYFFSQLGAARHLGGAVGGLEYLSNDKDFLATRACFKLNLRGPGLTVQTASSSALVAVHLACQCLLAGDCDVALAGGATVRVPHLAGYLWRDGGILSPDGHCRAFDAAAQGTVLGSGVGVVALKRLAQAVADGDHVEAVILGSAINNDGAAKESFAAPSLAGQAAAIRRALAQAGVGAGTVGYVEAHGSGTPTGDPLELAALAAAFRDQAVTAGRCAVGSVKTNVGHLEAAAGVAALIKTVLALRHGMLPPTLHFSRPNPALALAGSPFFVNTALAGWPASGAPRRAVVNSLGFGGTNACVVLEEAPQASSRRERRRPWGLLRLSAHTPRALDQLAGRFELWLGESGERGAVPPELADVCFTAANGRSELAERAAVVGASSAELRLALADLRSRGAGQPPVPARHARAGRRQAPRVAFLFTGQGAQHPGMGRQLFEHEPVFRRTLETCDEIVGDQLPARLLAAIHGDGAAAALAETRWAQPALFALEVALAELWRSWGIEPALVLGHSIGEYAAACVAGIFDLEEGLRLVVERGRLMQALPGAGAMAAVQASAAWTLETVLGDAGEVTIAALNGPADTVIAGPAAAVEQACARIAAHGVRCRRLAVSHAFHSPLMDPALDELEAACAGVAARAPRLPWICNLTGRPWPEGGFPPAPGAPYWRRHARQPVLFGAGVAAALELGCDAMLEVGPSPALLPMARRVCVAAGRVPAGGPPAPAFLPSLEPRRQDLQVMLESLGRLYVGGATVDWSRVEGKGRRVALPTYPFQRQRHWLETAPATAPAAVLGAEPAPVAVPDERVAADEGAGLLRDGLLQADAGARLAAAATFVRGQVCRVLGLRPDQVGRRDRFFDLGLDSLLALDLRAALAAALGPAVRLSSTVVLDFPDVERLARHVADLTESSPQAAAAAGVPLAAAGGGSPRAVEAGHATGRSAPLEPRRRLRIADPEGAGGEPIAVIGIGCRFPGGASDPEAFWEVIREGRDCVTTVPRNRFDAAALYDPDRDAPGRLYTRHGAFLAECDRFDGDFFGISPREAALLDPQHRLLLEVAWEALERAGQAPDELAGTETGVYLGLSTRDYARLQAAAAAGGARQEDGYGLTGNDFSFAAGRLSYLLGLHGPSVAVDTACSSSLVAIHLACQALRAGECELALAGGVNLILSPDTTLAHCRLHALSPDGRCKVFDAAADGYGRGEGGGVLVLRRLPEARRRREPIVAVVLGSAVNHDGHSAGLTVPSGPAQQRLLRSALRAAGVAPAAVGYVEAHGTGTALGDPIEVQALAAVLAAGRPADRPLAVGSVKACIGHLEAAAGVAGLIKAALVLAKREIPGQPLLRQPNPHIPWHELPLVVPTAAGAFPAGSPRRIAGVSSFGLGGTNAHVVLEEPAAEEPEEPEEPEAEPGWHLLRLSARDEAALAELAARVAAALEAGGGGQRPLRLADVCFTANSCRAELAHRLAVVGRSPAAIAGQLARFAAAGEAPGVWSGPAAADGRGVACVYPGEDAAYAGMARSLFATEPVFRSVMERCAELLAGALDRPLLACLYGGAAALAPGLESQAALFAVEVALAELWRSWGVAGSLHAGAGVGGIAAAWAAGRLDLDAAVLQLRQQARLAGDPAGDPAGEAVAAVARSQAAGSAVLVMGPEAGMARRLAESLAAAGRGSPAPLTCASLPPAPGDAEERPQALAALAALYAGGVSVDWHGFHRGIGRRVPLPTYPFRRRRYWLRAGEAAQPAAAAADAGAGGAGATAHPLLGRRYPTAAAHCLFVARLGAGVPALLDQHRLDAAAVLPATAYLEMGLAAAAELAIGALAVEDLVVRRPLVLPPAGTRPVQTIATEGQDGCIELSCFAADDENAAASWELHATWRLRRRAEPVPQPAAVLPQDLRSRLAAELDGGELYRLLQDSGLDLGPSFRWTTRIWWGDGEALAQLRPAAPADRAEDYHVHPGLLDAGMQLTLAIAGRRDAASFLPLAAGSCRLWPAAAARWCHVARRDAESVRGELFTADVRLLDDAGRCLVELLGLQARRLRRLPARLAAAGAPATLAAAAASDTEIESLLHEVIWRPAAPASTPPAALPAAARWLIAADLRGVGEALAGLLRRRGGMPVLVGAGAPAPPEECRRDLLRAAARGPWDAVVHLAAPGAAAPFPASGADGGQTETLPETSLELAAGVLDLVRALADAKGGSPRLVLVTRGGQAAPPAAVAAGLAQAPLWGLGAAIAQERPELRCLRIDLDPLRPEPPAAEAAALYDLIQSSGGAGQAACRQGVWYEPALVPCADARRPSGVLRRPEGGYRLEVEQPGTLDALRLAARARAPLAPGEVELEVEAAGLNFRDVLNALGTYPGDPGPLGLECAGRVTALGAEATGLAIGDRVFGIAFGSFADRATAPRELLAPVPETLTMEEAATVPVAFLTALFTLRRQARLAPGERVLIHGAAGGVGLAAMQVALRSGARVFATASPGKWELVARAGAAAVFDSRSLDFARELPARNGGQGIEVVLNSLAGEFIPKSLGLLAPGGRFLEIGKTGILDRSGAAALRPDVAYSTFDLVETCRSEPGAIGSLLRDLAAGLAAGVWRPLPRTVWPLAEAVAAFRSMAQARHVGKIVLSGRPDAGRRPVLRTDATYLVTGGLGALGRRAAACLVELGARHLALVGRSAPTVACRTALAALAGSGARFSIHSADVADRGQLAAVLAAIDEAGPPLAGVIHAAGVLADGVAAEQDRASLRAVWHPKVAGAWLLHLLTRERPLDFFILFSSVAGVLGGAGQAGYAAANAFLDFLAHHRRALGLPALALDWGPWAEAGMAAALSAHDRRRWERRGLRPLPPAAGLRALTLAMARNAAQLAVADLEEAAAAAAAPPPVPLAWRLRCRAAVAEERHELVLDEVRRLAARVLGVDHPELLDVRRPLLDLGLDSLMAVELRNALAAATGADLPATLIFQRPTLAALAAHLADDVLGETAGGTEMPAAPAAAAGLGDESGEGTAGDLAGLLARELAALRQEGGR